MNRRAKHPLLIEEFPFKGRNSNETKLWLVSKKKGQLQNINSFLVLAKEEIWKFPLSYPSYGGFPPILFFFWKCVCAHPHRKKLMKNPGNRERET